jgi:hypothetical protein
LEPSIEKIDKQLLENLNEVDLLLLGTSSEKLSAGFLDLVRSIEPLEIIALSSSINMSTLKNNFTNFELVKKIKRKKEDYHIGESDINTKLVILDC